jgi:predicted AAA+ superfamily ATPase
MLGPRQTGKSTLLGRLPCDLLISFVRPDIRLRYERDPAQLVGEIAATSAKRSDKQRVVFLDEVQRVPAILDVVQDLIDRKVAIFVLTGSSARKLRKGPRVNLLPGRVVELRMDPLMLQETQKRKLEELLLYGSLPGIYLQNSRRDKEEDLKSYVTTYLEQEVRAEALVRNLAAYARFLELACTESGRLISFRKLSQEVGVAHTTIASYYEVLQDCLIAERIDPLVSGQSRRKLSRSSKYMIFDLGVRRVCAREGTRLPKAHMAHLFEQWVGLELIRAARAASSRYRLMFWRVHQGPEVDWVLVGEGRHIPVEVKWTDTPKRKDAWQIETNTTGASGASRKGRGTGTPRGEYAGSRAWNRGPRSRRTP